MGYSIIYKKKVGDDNVWERKEYVIGTKHLSMKNVWICCLAKQLHIISERIIKEALFVFWDTETYVGT